MTTDLQQRLRRLSNQDLIAVIATEDKFSPEAVNEARIELEHRGRIDSLSGASNRAAANPEDADGTKGLAKWSVWEKSDPAHTSPAQR